MMLKSQIDIEIKNLNEYFATIHQRYASGNLSHEVYILLLMEHNALIKAYMNVRDTKRVIKKQAINSVKQVDRVL